MCVAVSVGLRVSVEVFTNLTVRESFLRILCGMKCTDEQFVKIWKSASHHRVMYLKKITMNSFSINFTSASGSNSPFATVNHWMIALAIHILLESRVLFYEMANL